ncbi:MAG TPA: carbon-nitrogen hydrolase family protein [Polyangiaceae bacterium]|jgi:predicted amidohydrolase|nr:carbon-nitrogen hydrolase family protein [Polyangiaceae bacterium]
MANDSLRVAAVQVSSQDDLASNLAACRAQIDAAAAQRPELVLLPENFAYMGPDDGKQTVVERLGDRNAPIQRMLADAAKAHGVTIVAGGFPEQSDDPRRPYNTCAVYDAHGELVASYRKIHLFDVELADGSSYRESAGSSAGSAPTVVTVGGFKVGLSICYDLRFPELYRALVDRGAEVLVVPAAFTVHTGKDHWHVLLRARAIEAQCFVVAAGQWGKHPLGRTTYGHSLVVDPWGTVLADAPDRTGFIVAELPRADLTRVRGSLPSLRHRRL